jgi:CheY-like chemotaxis protein
MENKQNKFLLIDDDKATNFINKTVIKKTFFTDDVIIAQNGIEALNILNNGCSPEIIFLDINMPVMNGWEFLEEFKNLDIDSEIVVMIGEALTESEYNFLNNEYGIGKFNKKILDRDSLYNIVNLKHLV